MVRVVAALIWKGDKFFICQRPGHKARGMLWEFVGGKIEEGEMPEEALKRECFEELGVDVEVRGLFAKTQYDYGDIKVDLLLYDAVFTDQLPRLIEHNAFAWITANEINEYKFCRADYFLLDNIKRQDEAFRIQRDCYDSVLAAKIYDKAAYDYKMRDIAQKMNMTGRVE